MPTRREFLAASAVAGFSARAQAADRKFTMAFTPGSIGVRADQEKAITLAAKHGFGSVQPYAGDLAALSASERKAMPKKLRKTGLQWAAAGLPVDYRKDEATYRDGVQKLREQAPVLAEAGVTRMGTWLTPASDELTYLAHFRQTARRLREMATIIGDHGMKLGLEYVGTPSLRVGRNYGFVHSMAETKELIAEAHSPHLGFVLDSWHWWTAGEGKADILTLRSEDVVSADLNDAPKGRTMIEQIDGERELPVATGVIPLGDFLSALVEIGYDGPIRPEPFNKALNEMDDEPASAAAGAAMKKAFDLVA